MATADPHRRFIAPITLLVLLGCTALVWAMTRMSAASLSYVNYFTQFLLVVLGAGVVAREHWPKRHPWLTIGTFVLAGGIGMFAAIRQGQESAKETSEAQRQAAEASTKLHESMNRLGKQNGDLNSKTDEIRRVEGLNTELQQKLLGQSGQLMESSKRIAELSKEGIATATGGESFCYIDLNDQWTASGLTPVFITVGKQPLYDVDARITNMRKYEYISAQAKGRSMTIAEVFAADTNVHPGNLSNTTAYIPPNAVITIDGSSQQYFVAWFSARNGIWFEDIEIQKVGGNWKHAIRVFRQMGANKKKLILTKIDRTFPGKPAWHT